MRYNIILALGVEPNDSICIYCEMITTISLVKIHHYVVVVHLLSRVWLWFHELQHTRTLCPSLSPGVCSYSCRWSQWCHPTISSSVTPSSLALNLSQHRGLFQQVDSLHPKCWSFSMDHSEFTSNYLSFKTDCFVILRDSMAQKFGKSMVGMINSLTALEL